MPPTAKDGEALVRQELASQHYSEVDLALKELHRLVKRAKEIHDSLLDDFHLLQRLHYKGQNQHHAAIFWKRAQEVRRILQRVCGSNLGDLIESLARQCHHHQLERRQIWRTAWTQLPSSAFLGACASRIVNLHLLVEKGIQKCETTYAILVVQMRSAAFLPFTLALASVVARVRTLMSELDPVIRQTQEFSSLFIQLHELHRTAQVGQRCNTLERFIPSQSMSLEAIHKVVFDGSVSLCLTTIAPPKPPDKRKKRNKPKFSETYDEIDEIFGF